MEDVQNLFKETIAEFMESGLDVELEDELGYSRYDYKNKDTENSRNGHSGKTLRTRFGDVMVIQDDGKGFTEKELKKLNNVTIAEKIPTTVTIANINLRPIIIIVNKSLQSFATKDNKKCT